MTASRTGRTDSRLQYPVAGAGVRSYDDRKLWQVDMRAELAHVVAIDPAAEGWEVIGEVPSEEVRQVRQALAAWPQRDADGRVLIE